MNAYSFVDAFERRVAEFSGAPFAVAVDSCTNALFLSLMWMARQNAGSLPALEIPARTYVSVPQAIRQAGFAFTLVDKPWVGVYDLEPLGVRDGAKRFRRGMYKYGYHCLSFHIKKNLPIGRGGMVLHSSPAFDAWARAARHNGRPDKDATRVATQEGWDCYMTPEQAARGMALMDVMPPNGFPDQTEDYPDLRTMEVFK